MSTLGHKQTLCEFSQNVRYGFRLCENHATPRINAVDLKNVLRKINANRDNFVHGRILFPYG